MHARARKRQKRAQLFISVRMHVLGAYVRVHARIIMKINVDSLSLKFDKDLFIGCWNKNVYAFLPFLNVFLDIFQI